MLIPTHIKDSSFYKRGSSKAEFLNVFFLLSPHKGYRFEKGKGFTLKERHKTKVSIYKLYTTQLYSINNPLLLFIAIIITVKY